MNGFMVERKENIVEYYKYIVIFKVFDQKCLFEIFMFFLLVKRSYKDNFDVFVGGEK